jgi:hypothetical protein
MEMDGRRTGIFSLQFLGRGLSERRHTSLAHSYPKRKIRESMPLHEPFTSRPKLNQSIAVVLIAAFPSPFFKYSLLQQTNCRYLPSPS